MPLPTLLWRTVLLLAVLLAVSHLVDFHLPLRLGARPVAQQSADIIVLTRGLINADEQRVTLLLSCPPEHPASTQHGRRTHRTAARPAAADADRAGRPRPARPRHAHHARTQRHCRRLGELPHRRGRLLGHGSARHRTPETWRWSRPRRGGLLLSGAGRRRHRCRVNRPLRALARAAGDLGRGREQAPDPGGARGNRASPGRSTGQRQEPPEHGSASAR